MHLLVSVRGYAIRIVLLCMAITLPALSEAEDLAQGHHLWTVDIANGSKTFIAAGTYATDPRADVILHRQLKAIGNVKLVALSSDGRAPEIAKEAWMRKASEALPADLQAEVEKEVAPVLASVGMPTDKLHDAPLQVFRLLLPFGTGQLQANSNSRNETTYHKYLGDYIRKQGAQPIILRTRSAAELQSKAADMEKEDVLPPQEIIRRLMEDRRQNGPLAERAMQTIIAGDWSGREKLTPIFGMTLFGLEPDAYRRHRDITGSSLADLAEPVLAKPGPNLIVVWEVEDLGGSSGMIATLQNRGFRIAPVALPDLP